MTIQINYPTKKELKKNIGKRLSYTETSFFGNEYKENGVLVGCDVKRKFFAKITIKNNLIDSVE